MELLGVLLPGCIPWLNHYSDSFFREQQQFVGFAQSDSRWVKFIQWAVTFYLVLIGWVLFRAETLTGAWDMLLNMHSFASTVASGNSALLILSLVVGSTLVIHLMDYFVLYKAEKLESKWWLFWPLLIIGHFLVFMIGKPSTEFIYFQF